jgi:hypothetical protein
MSLRGFQQALSELVMQPALRRRLAEGAEEETAAALAAYDLSERERRRLALLVRDPGLQTGTTIHRSFRLSMLANALPRTCKALRPPELKELVYAYWREHLPRSYQYLPEARGFAEFALARVRAGGLVNPFAEEVLEAELAMIALARVEAWQPPEATGEETGEGGDAKVRLHPLCRIVPFRHDPDTLLPALAAGRVPADGADALPEGEHYLLLLSAGEGKIDLHSIGREQGRAMMACSEEARRVETLAERADLAPAEGAAVVDGLLRLGWLRVEPGEP